MIHRIADKVLLIIFITAAIALTFKSVTAVHVCVVLGAVIIGSIDEFSNHKAMPYIAAAIALLSSFIFSVAVLLIPMAIYVLIYRRQPIESIIAAFLVVMSLCLTDDFIFSALCLSISLISAYISWTTSYYETSISRSNSMFDEARQQALENVRKRREIRDRTENEIYTARLKERNRIAREIHDNVGHMITRVIVQMKAIQIINKDPVVGEQLESVSDTLDLAMTGIRRSVHELHDDSIDLAIGVNDIAKTLPERFTCDVSTSIESPADNETKTAILGIIKEAVTNISKHSNGDKVSIEVVENVSFWKVLIHDNGKCSKMDYSDVDRMTSDGHGIGLSNIFDRAHGVCGRARISSDESGFDVHVTIPKKEMK